MVNEEWRPVKGYEGFYEVSNLGRVKSIPREVYCCLRWNNKKKFNGNILKPIIRGGYYHVELCSPIRKRLKLHRVIAMAWIENKHKKPHINHKNGIKTDNRIENLEWCTPAENTKHAIRTGLADTRIDIIQKTLDGKVVKEWHGLKYAAKECNISPSSIQHVLYGKQRSAKGFIWEYKKR